MFYSISIRSLIDVLKSLFSTNQDVDLSNRVSYANARPSHTCLDVVVVEELERKNETLSIAHPGLASKQPAHDPSPWGGRTPLILLLASTTGVPW